MKQSCEECGIRKGLFKHRHEVLCRACLAKARQKDPKDGWYACPMWLPIKVGE